MDMQVQDIAKQAFVESGERSTLSDENRSNFSSGCSWAPELGLRHLAAARELSLSDGTETATLGIAT